MFRAKSRDEIDNFLYVGLVSSCLFVEFTVFWLITVALASISSPDVEKNRKTIPLLQ